MTGTLGHTEHQPQDREDRSEEYKALGLTVPRPMLIQGGSNSRVEAFRIRPTFLPARR
jgi:hypothetical protein